jgi:2-amino-4-hydroxy-6-hydroxymethyldihydropteridine diphosphokinase
MNPRSFAHHALPRASGLCWATRVKSANIRPEVLPLALVYLGLGSNLGDRRLNLEAAVTALDQTPGMRVRRVSSFSVTAPFGVQDQPDFLNGVAEIETELNPPHLLAVVKQVELKLGRVTSFRWGPRLIDIDILLYDRIRWQSPELTIPHPGILERSFVMEPLAELAPERLAELRHDASLPI